MNDELSNFKVTDRTAFSNFLDLLLKDFLDHQDSWENRNLQDFLEALSSYSKEIQGYYDNTGQNIDSNKPSWQTFADMLKGATIYE